MPEPAAPAPVADEPSFLEMFKNLEDGKLDGDLTEALVNLVHDMRAYALATGIKPKASISIRVEFRLDGGIFEAVPSFTVKPPKKPRSRSIYYATKDNGLSVNNPAQRALALGEPKDVTGGRPLSVMG